MVYIRFEIYRVIIQLKDSLEKDHMPHPRLFPVFCIIDNFLTIRRKTSFPVYLWYCDMCYFSTKKEIIRNWNFVRIS